MREFRKHVGCEHHDRENFDESDNVSGSLGEDTDLKANDKTQITSEMDDDRDTTNADGFYLVEHEHDVD